MRFGSDPARPEGDPTVRGTSSAGGTVPDLAIEFIVRPPTVAAAVYGVMTVVSEHTSSLARLDDLRVALDELFYALPQDERIRVDLTVRVEDGRSKVRFHVDVPDVDVHPSVAALVDRIDVVHTNGETTAELAVQHD